MQRESRVCGQRVESSSVLSMKFVGIWWFGWGAGGTGGGEKVLEAGSRDDRRPDGNQPARGSPGHETSLVM